MNLKKRLHLPKFIRHVGLAFALQVSGAGLTFLMQIALARWMGAPSYGAYAYTIAIATVLGAATGLGLPTALLRYIPAYLTAKDWPRLHGVLSASMVITLLAGIGAAFLLTMCIFLAHILMRTSLQPTLMVALWLIPLIGFMNLQTETVRAFRRVALAFAPSLVVRPLLVIFGAAGLVILGYHLSATAVLAATGISILLLLALQMSLFWRGLDSDITGSAPLYEIREWLRVALPMLLISGFVLLLLQSDIIMVGLVRGPREAGFYTAASKTASVVGLVLIAVNAISAPRFAALFARGEHEKLQRVAAASAALAFWPSLALSILLAIVGRIVLGFFGPGFSSATSILLVLLIGQLINAAAGSVGYLMILTGNQREAARVYGSVTVGHLAMTPLAILAFGSIGAAIATSVSFAFWNLWLSVLAMRRLDINASIFSSLRRSSS